jgi:hypothetical protein
VSYFVNKKTKVLPMSLGWQVLTTMPSLLVEMSLDNLLPLNYDPPDLLSSWNYRLELLFPQEAIFNSPNSSTLPLLAGLVPEKR